MTDLVAMGRLDATDFAPIDPEEVGAQVLEGDPDPRVHTLVANETTWSGLSIVHPSRFKIPYPNHTMITFLEGEVTLTLDGKSHEARAGDIVFFAPGSEVIMDVKQTLRDMFIMHGTFDQP